MTIPNYALAGSYAKVCEAIAKVEHWGHDPHASDDCMHGQCPYGRNDGRQAVGLLQMHPSEIAVLYPKVADLRHTVAEMEIRCFGVHMTKLCAGSLAKPWSIEQGIIAWNKGDSAVAQALLKGETLEVLDPMYLSHFRQAYTK